MWTNKWHYELNETPSGYYVMTIRNGPPPWEIPYNEGYWICVKTIDGGFGKKWIRGKKPVSIKLKEAIKNKMSHFKQCLLGKTKKCN
jgi:hypothetical protein